MRADQEEALERMERLTEEMEHTKDLRRIRQIAIQLRQESKRLNAEEPGPTPAST